MTFDPRVLSNLARRFSAKGYVRILSRNYRDTPLGMGYGLTRFSSPTNSFKLLYLARDTATAIAETIVRDRFDGVTPRRIHEDELDGYSIAEVRNPKPLVLLDLRHQGTNLLGVSTDAVRAKAQSEGRAFSQELYDTTDFDGVLYMSRITNRACVAAYERAVVSKLEADTPAFDLPTLASLPDDLAKLMIEVISSPTP